MGRSSEPDAVSDQHLTLKIPLHYGVQRLVYNRSRANTNRLKLIRIEIDSSPKAPQLLVNPAGAHHIGDLQPCLVVLSDFLFCFSGIFSTIFWVVEKSWWPDELDRVTQLLEIASLVQHARHLDQILHRGVTNLRPCGPFPNPHHRPNPPAPSDARDAWWETFGNATVPQTAKSQHCSALKPGEPLQGSLSDRSPRAGSVG